MSAESDKLQAVLADLQSKVKKLESGGSASQLSFSAVETTEGRGYIPVMENGVEKHRIGRQPDGTITSVSVNNTDPPSIPNDPVCSPFLGGVTVQCTGFQATQYLDFSHINIYCDGGVVATMTKIPDAVAVSPLDQNPHTFQLTSVNLSGTESPKTNAVLCTPNLVVSADVADGIITTLKLADDAVTNAKIAAAAVSNVEIAANTIQGNNIAGSTISGDKIAGQTITGGNILSQTITALQLAVNAVEATNIKAGSVDATKLNAQIIIAAVSFIVGNPVAQRLVLDKLGLSQYDGQGNLALQFGATPTSGGGNFLTILDPKDSTNALASIGQDGSMTMNGASITGAASLNGVDLVQFLNNLPGGIVTYGNVPGLTAYTTSEVGFYEISYTQVSGRAYRLTTTNWFFQGGGGAVLARITDDGSTPTISSPALTVATGADGTVQFQTASPNSTRVDNDTTPTGNTGVGTGGGTNGLTAGGGADGHNHYYGTNHTHDAGSHYHGLNHGHNYDHAHPFRSQFAASGMNALLGRSDGDRRVRILFTVSSLYGGSVRTYGQGGVGAQMWIEDVGSLASITGGSNAGGGSSSATGTFVSTWAATNSAWFTSAENFSIAHVGDMRQGFDGTSYYTSQFSFDINAIQSAISSSTIQKIEVYLYAYYWTLASGGTASIGTYSDSTGPPPTSYSFATRNLVDQKMGKPQGLWITLPNSIGNSLKNATIKGFVLDSRARSDESSQVNFSRYRDSSYTTAGIRPGLRITYVK